MSQRKRCHLISLWSAEANRADGGTNRGKVEIRILLLLAPQETTHPRRIQVPVQPTGVAAQRQPLSPKHGQPWLWHLQSQLNDVREKSIASILLTADVSASLLSSSEGLGG